MPDTQKRLLLVLVFIADHAYADSIRERAQPLSTMTVFGTAGTVWEQPKSITVIDRNDILNAPSNSLIDLLSREANITVRSFTGHDKFGGVDIRGMGDSLHSNVLILVDGIRLNAPDLSGADLSTMTLGQIERIEIIRGGSGVLYGDGAVGGVVNIVTRKTDRTRAEIYGSYGHFDTSDVRLNAGYKQGPFRISVNGAYFNTDGYRDNTFLEKRQFSAHVDFEPLDRLNLYANFRLHDDEFGLAGTVDRSAISHSSLRRKASTPFAGGETFDYAVNTGGSFDWGNFGLTRINLGYRDRDNPYELANYWNPDQRFVNPWKNEFDNREIDARHQVDFSTGPINQTWTFGYFRRQGQAIRRENGNDIPDQSKVKRSEFNNQSGFVNTVWELPVPVIFNAGYREDRFDLKGTSDEFRRFCTFASVFPFQPLDCNDRWTQVSSRKNNWRSYAADFGLTWTINESVSWYMNHNRSYRNPNPEELLLSADSIKPQKGENWETGLRFSLLPWSEMSLAFFQMTHTDEIYFDDRINKNYENDTIRRGLEFESRFYLSDAFSLWTNFGYTDARFDKTNLSMPLVPKINANAGFLWHTTERLSVSLSAEYTGTRPNGLNITPEADEPSLSAFKKVDLKVFYQIAGAELFAGINNLFNAFYETSAYGGGFYPMPERHAYVGLSYSYQSTGDH